MDGVIEAPGVRRQASRHFGRLRQQLFNIDRIFWGTPTEPRFLKFNHSYKEKAPLGPGSFTFKKHDLDF